MIRAWLHPARLRRAIAECPAGSSPPEPREIAPVVPETPDHTDGTAPGVENVLFLTATIRPPPNAHGLAYTDPVQRMRDYEKALGFYCPLLGRGVFDYLLLVENSGSDLAPLVQVVRNHGLCDRAEFITYHGMRRLDMSSLNRFCGEVRLMRYAMENADVVRRHPHAVIWKVSGRYIIRNLKQIIRSRPEGFDLYVNCRDYPHRFVDFYIVGFHAAAFLATIGARWGDYATTASGETVLRHQIDDGTFPDHRIVKRFKRTPKIIGIRGVDGRKYHDTRASAKYAVRALMNRLAPNVWV